MTHRIGPWTAALAAIVLPFTLACDDATGPGELPAGVPTTEAMSIEPGHVTIRVGESVQLVAEVRGWDGTPLSDEDRQAIEWSTDHPDIVAVHVNGIIDGLAVGQARVNAGCGEYCAFATVTVVPEGEIHPPVGAGRGR